MNASEKPSAQSDTPEHIAFQLMLASNQLEQHRRAVCCEINGRTRQLRGLLNSLQTAHLAHTDELFEVGPLLTPEIKRLIANPLVGL